jgi:hypothetical protein
MFTKVAAVLSLSMAVCNPSPPTNQTVSGSTLCDHLATIGCPQGPKCAVAWDHNGSLLATDPNRVLAIQSKDDAEKLGLACPP